MGRSFRGSRWYFFPLFLAGMAVLCPSARLFAQVDRDELSRNLGPVYFTNYEGPYSRIESRAQILNIGYSLGTAAREGALQAGGTDRYFVIHSLSGPEGDKLDADIFGLGADVGVDHIRNLRLIIQGYLEGAYGYTPEDAALLAEYITVYNAVYRGDWDYVVSRYKTPVCGYLTREKMGLSIRYDEWPGQTLMLIPLGPGGPGSLSAINTSSLIEGKVTDELRKDDGQGLDQRKGMVDLLERESAEADQRAANQRAAAAGEERRIASERQANSAERDRIAQERQRVQEDAEAGKISAGEAQEADDQLAAREEAADRKDAELDNRQAAVAEGKEEAQRAEDFAGQKTGEARQQRQEIASDQQAQIAREARLPPAPTGVLAAILSGPASPLGWLMRYDTSTGREVSRSLLNTVYPRTVITLDKRILAVAGETAGAIRLVEISPDTLEMVQQGQDDLSPDSLIWVNGADLYAITPSGGGLYLARFNGASLAREARSSERVHPYATVVFQGGILVTQRADGSVLALDAKTLAAKQ